MMRLSVLICMITAIHISAMTYTPASRISIKLRNTNIRQTSWGTGQSQGLTFLFNENAPGPEIKIFLQRLKVSGTVSDEATGETLPGVSIHVEGSQTGTITDVNGKYSIEVPDANSILLFSIVGYRTERISVSGRTTIDVKLTSEEKKLEEIVVVGYGTQKKVNLTGAVSSLNGDNVAQKPVTQLSAALQGLAPGVTITQSTGQPGVDAGTIRIRGVGTLNNNNPLVLVDGVEYDINNVDANDVENISILKDAAASSIYGVRAA
ncbi:MAG: carboxypeptidase-like regulatory domain-containing protein, partial [Bacteroidota bacterium]|nr:carboxypeptidase-like regulatory domain-containing protein [Bacteroidota bacterium]MDP4273965.1 carboxypeptidase-like regulatory domain-containing protein [Bacteroidota bacterium]